MKYSLTIFVALFVAIATYLITAGVMTHTAEAPISNGIAGSTVLPLSIVSYKDNASTSPTVSIEYPQFAGLDDFNAAIASTVSNAFADFKTIMAENEFAREHTSTGTKDAAIAPNDYNFNVTWQAAQITARYISIIVRIDGYSGGANENQQIITFNYDQNAHKLLSLADLFPGKPDYLKNISDQARGELSDSLRTASPGYDPAAQLEPGTEPTAENFKNFTFTDGLVTIYFPKYAVAPGSFGEQHVTIPLSSFTK